MLFVFFQQNFSKIFTNCPVTRKRRIFYFIIEFVFFRILLCFQSPNRFAHSFENFICSSFFNIFFWWVIFIFLQNRLWILKLLYFFFLAIVVFQTFSEVFLLLFLFFPTHHSTSSRFFVFLKFFFASNHLTVLHALLKSIFDFLESLLLVFLFRPLLFNIVFCSGKFFCFCFSFNCHFLTIFEIFFSSPFQHLSRLFCCFFY